MKGWTKFQHILISVKAGSLQQDGVCSCFLIIVQGITPFNIDDCRSILKKRTYLLVNVMASPIRRFLGK